MSDPFQVVRDFEAELCQYTSARLAVTTTSCTAALLLACAWCRVETVEIPKRTYCSVPMSIIHAGGKVSFRDEEWRGVYQLKPYPIWDAARRFTRDMWPKLGGFVCVSFHSSKILGLGQGGAILHNSPEADAWLRKARFDGRTEGLPPSADNFDMLGYHAYMAPETAAQGLVRLALLPEHNDDLPNDDYPDLSTFEVFR